MASALGPPPPKVTDYYASMLVGICNGPVDSINGILIGDKYIYPVSDPNSIGTTHLVVQPDGETWNVGNTWSNMPTITANTVLSVNLPDLFGGDSGEGGLIGAAGMFLGSGTQVLPDSFASRFGGTGATTPGYRNITSAFFTHSWSPDWGFLWSTNAPVLRSTKFTVTRIPRPTGMDSTYASIPAIPVPRVRTVSLPDTSTNPTSYYQQTIHDLYTAGPDANGANIIFECLTNTDFGLSMDPSLIDVASFNTAAAIIFAENIGLSFTWSTQKSVLDFINTVEAHLDGKLFINPATGLLTLRLVRAVTNLTGAVAFDDTNSTIKSYQTKGWADTVNTFIVHWTDPFTEQSETFLVQNNANIAIQGYAVADNKNYTGARNPATAQTIAMRDLRAASTPLSTIELEANRIAWSVNPTDVVLVSSVEYGLQGKAYRVIKVDYGKTNSYAIRLSLVEDVFSTAVGDIQNAPQVRGVVSFSNPSALSTEFVITAPAYLLAQAGLLNTLVAGDAYMAFIGWANAGNFIDGKLNARSVDSSGNPTFNVVATVPPVGRTQSALALEATSYLSTVGLYVGGVSSDPTQAFAPPYVGWFGVVGDTTDDVREIVMVRQIDLTNGTPSALWLIRGCFDTVPRVWPALTSIYWLDPAVDLIAHTLEAVGATIDYRYQAATSNGVLPVTAVPDFTGVVTDRPNLPNRPAGITLNGLGLPAAWSFALVNNVETPQLPSSTIPALPLVAGVPTITLATGATLTVAWARRNRLTEDNQVLSWLDADMTPESGQTTRIRLEQPAGTVLFEQAGIAGTSFTIPATVVNTVKNAVLKVFADNGPLTSLQFAEFGLIGPAP